VLAMYPLQLNTPVPGKRTLGPVSTVTSPLWGGGFAFEADDSQANFLPDPYTRLTLTPRALRKLAEVEPMLVPDLSERAIKDKVKLVG
jgi:hypothetical protein